MAPGNGLAAEFREITEGTSVPQLRKNTASFWKAHRDDPAGVCSALTGLWAGAPSNDVRMGIAMTLGPAATEVDAAMSFLLETVPDEDDWRVQEALAKGFDWYCATRGWRESESMIMNWLDHEHHNVRRAASEGPRVWTKRDYFRDYPRRALELLGRVRADDSAYVRKSVANAVSDISKTHPEQTLILLAKWAKESASAWVVRNACRHLAKTHPGETETVLAALKGITR